MKRYVMELVGTFFLMHAIIMSDSTSFILPGLMLIALLYVGGHVSGGYFNPALVLIGWVRGTLDAATAGIYMVMQVIGACLSALLYAKLMGNSFEIALPSEAMIPVMSLEIIHAFLFGLVFVTMVTNFRFKNTTLYAPAIGLALMALGGLRAVVNPAVGATALLSGIFWQTGFSVPVVVAYIIGPMVGAVIASYAYNFYND